MCQFPSYAIENFSCLVTNRDVMNFCFSRYWYLKFLVVFLDYSDTRECHKKNLRGKKNPYFVLHFYFKLYYTRIT